MESHGTAWNLRKEQLSATNPTPPALSTPPTPPLPTPPLTHSPAQSFYSSSAVQHSAPIAVKAIAPHSYISSTQSSPLAYSSPIPIHPSHPHSLSGMSAASAPVSGNRPGHYRRKSRRVSQDLFECIEANPFMAEDKVQYIFKQIAQAVGYLHQNNVVHRDIKDENVGIFGCS